MKKWHRNVGIGLIGIGSALSILFSVENTSANEADNFVTEAAVVAEAYAAMNVQSQHQLVSGLSASQVQGLDIETAMMAVQSQRASLLDSQLREQINSVNDRNNQVATKNEELQALNEKLAKFPADDNSEEKKKLENERNTLKSQIDSLSNSQQMDMLRLQSLSNKRNEAFDLMTEFIKKMNDSRSSIIGNMR